MLYAVDFAEIFQKHPVTGILFFGWYLRTFIIDEFGSQWAGLASLAGILVEVVIALLIWRFIKFIIKSFRKE